MGIHKLEIELSDDLLRKVERISEKSNSSTSQIVVEALENLIEDRAGAETDIAQRRAAMNDIFERVSKAGRGLSKEEIDRQIREFRADREHI